MMNLTKAKEALQLVDGIYQIKVEMSVHELILTSKSFTKSEVLLHNCGSEMNISIIMEENAHLSLVMIHSMIDSELKVEVQMQENSTLNLGHLDMEPHQQEMKEVVHLNGENAQVHVISNSLVSTQKHFEFLIAHHTPHTIGVMNHYAVVYEGGNYRMFGDGHIDHGSNGSKSHQSTRVLTMSDKQKSEVIPVLTIDENDVEASHAMSLGQMDEMQAYYLQSRGLTRMQAIGLLTIGYFMPIVELLENQELQDIVRKKIQEKVGVKDGYK
ncbi:MAG: SufD family Fe-S cluster assembly protein [Erysipelotrichaceae bacterium]